MEFKLDKCARAILIITGKFFKFSNVVLDVNITIRKLECIKADVHIYLGMNEGDGVQHSKMKERVLKECY